MPACPKPQKPWRSKDYLRWVASLPCAYCGQRGRSNAHHIKGRGHHSGASRRADDRLTMPLCVSDSLRAGCHDRLHGKECYRLDCQAEAVMETQRLAVEAGVLDEDMILNIGGE